MSFSVDVMLQKEVSLMSVLCLKFRHLVWLVKRCKCLIKLSMTAWLQVNKVRSRVMVLVAWHPLPKNDVLSTKLAPMLLSEVS